MDQIYRNLLVLWLKILVHMLYQSSQMAAMCSASVSANSLYVRSYLSTTEKYTGKHWHSGNIDFNVTSFPCAGYNSCDE